MGTQAAIQRLEAKFGKEDENDMGVCIDIIVCLPI
jgi:hypothetical protein